MPSEARARIGERRSYDGALCTVRYVGEVAGTTGSWLGVEWDDPSRGKHDGQHNGVRYFSCRSKSATAASFVRPTRPTDVPQTFLAALQLKYATDPTAGQNPPRQIVFSGKVAEEVGFEKVRHKQAQLDELQFVILDGAQIAYASPPPGGLSTARRVGSSPSANGNRFQHVLEDERLASAGDAFNGVTEFALEDTLLDWNEICHIAAKFPSLATLHAGSNQLPSLTPVAPAPFTSTLVSLHLEYNDFSSLADLAPLSAIPSLRNLLLKGNRISHITPPSSASATSPPNFPPSLHYLDISYNQIASWSFVDALPHSFPGLTSLRFTHNPIYDDPDLDDDGAPTSLAAPTTTTTQRKGVAKTDEAYMLVVARMPALRTLNFSAVTPADRADAEMFYLSRIARQLAAVPEAAEPAVLARHRRWAELCAAYGEPPVVRRGRVDPNFLEARLITVEFHYPGGGAQQKSVVVQVPKSFDIYAVKGLAGRLFGLPPLGLRLVWETGEWDPVGGFDEADGESEVEEEDLEAEWERRGEAGEPVGEAMEGKTKAGRWVKREVELKDGPRQLGYCVDGLEARIRVERR
ncbi:ca98271d-0c83-47cc-9465-03b08d6fff4f [Thermothielavioides terrestris]|uniref:Ca98271d-0c83-47cc-9465-03b08d6fff4f n=1 Tax=Thermothielavioides terrestris TaxID=2587410 RepID=A0A446B624_9PEZI|nr:ca98271d-0c83-47cc-9465-03b08d6fff4f [Thermothielavioides terrestris]